MFRLKDTRRASAVCSSCIAFGVMVLVAAHSETALAAPFTGGNLIVLRVGDGVSGLGGNSTAAFIEERTTAGALAQTAIPLQTATSGSGNRALNQRGTAIEGFLNLSANGLYLTVGGYNTALNASIATGDSRVCGRIDLNANIDSTTAVSNSGLANFRSLVSNDGTQFWIGSDTTIRYVASLGGTSTTSLTNFTSRVVGIFNGQLYVSAASGPFQGVGTVGTGFPTTTGQSTLLLNGFPTSSGPSAYDYYFANSTTLYVADERGGSSGGGIQQWKLFNDTWQLHHTMAVQSSIGVRGLTGSLDSSGVATLYATTTETSANRIVKITDTGTSPTFTTIATAGANTAFRGIRLLCSAAPVLSGVGPVNNQTVCGSSASFTVSPNGVGPFTYQWRRGTTNLTNGVNGFGTTIGGATKAVLTLSSIHAGDFASDYNCVVTNHCGSTTSSSAALVSSDPSPYCSISSTNCGNPIPNEYISSVTIGSINNASNYPSGCCYGNYTAQSTTVARGTGYPISVVDNYYFVSDLVSVWVDWDQNGDFSGLNERYDLTTTSPTLKYPAVFSGTITPPADAACGATRMRVRIQYGGTDATPVPCGTTSWGEVQDYTLIVGVSAAPSLSGPGSVCQGQPTVTLNSSAPNSGEIVEWFNGGVCGGASIGSGTSINVSTPGIGSTTYSAHIKCSNGGAMSGCSTVSVSVPDCDDGNPCTTDTCSGGVCSHTNNSNACTDDSDPCTLDVCSGGACAHIVQDADGDGICDANDTCPNTPNGEIANAQGCSCSQVNCDDGNPCTTDTCTAGVCSHTNNTNACASDSDPCTLDVCNGGACTHVFQDPDGDGVCDANDACPNTPNGEIVGAEGCSCSQLNCDDGNPCTTDSCTDGVCSHVNNTNACASDSDPCTLDVCSGGACTHVFQDADGDGVCDASDTCPNTLNGETANAEGCSCGQINCDDGDACTTDSCTDGVCSHTPVVCNDGDPCTIDTCDSQTGCVSTPMNCDDNDPCTNDSCQDGDCVHTASGTCESLTLNVVGSGLVCPSQTLDVTLDVSGLAQAINGVQALLHYDSALFTLSSITPGNGAGSPWDAAMPVGLIDNAGDVTYALVLTGPGSTASATVATLHFTVRLPGSVLDPSNVTFRPDQGASQTKLIVAADNSTILPTKVNSGPITVGPRVTLALQIQGLNHPATRMVTFSLTNCAAPSSPQVISLPVSFNASGVGNVILTGIDSGAAYLAVVEGHTLQHRIPLTFSSCFASASLTGSSQLISGDLQTSGVPQDNLVDILDFAIWVARLNSTVSDCNSGLPQDCSLGADINGDGIQDTADFIAIQMNFFDIGDAASACPPSRHKGGIVNAGGSSDARSPQLVVPVSRLPVALRASRQIDQNADGVIDARDIRAFARARGLPLLPQFEAKLSALERASSNP